MRRTAYGVWQETSWSETRELVELAANGSIALGVGVGDRVPVHSKGRWGWIFLNLFESMYQREWARRGLFVDTAGRLGTGHQVGLPSE